MMRSWKLVLLCGALSGALAAGCSPTPVGHDDGGTTTDGASQTDGGVVRPDGGVQCAAGEDADEDGIADRYEGTGDVDNDGVPNRQDPDSDGDGRSDALEANAGRPYDCSRPPLDSDGDGTPDFLDTDSDGNGVNDADEFAGEGDPPDEGWAAHPRDFDRDGIPDYADTDDDNDTINDLVEVGDNPATPLDTDGDGTPDYRDNDSDNDTVADAQEGSLDNDHDGTPNFRDDDSDGDTVLDRDEAGDTDVNTPPVECARELDSATLDLSMPHPDSIRDFLDIDSDNDGLSDREEVAAGTDRCNPDSDGDGQLDSAEVVWCNAHSDTHSHCATDNAVTIPATDYYLVLPNGGPVVQRELEFGTDIRVADVFFIFDTTGSMSGVQQGVANSIGAPMTGMVDQIRSVIPDTYFGVGHYDDFLAGGYGGCSDRPIHPLCDGPLGSHPTPECSSGTFGGITMQPPSMAMAVQAGAQAIPGGCGSDGPESAVEALYQIVTNEGLYDRSAPSACAGSVGTAPCWVRPTACPEGTWGYPCFREGALAIVVHFTDAPFHNGARDESPPSTTYYDPYMGISPTPHNFDQMVMAYQRHSARQISIAASSRCEGRLFTNHSEYGPCYDYRKVAEGTGSVDLDGNPLIYDLPAGVGSGTPPAEFVGLVTDAVRTLATRVPIDINTSTRNDPANPAMVDARQFIKRRVPSCQIAPVNNECWNEPTGVAHRDAVGRTDLSTFYRVVPGTRVRFTIFFQNDGVFEGDPTGVTLFHAFIDVVGDGVTRLDTREVYILVPAAYPGGIG